jgi:predicted DNA-binding transcriptional regulator AlpA
MNFDELPDSALVRLNNVLAPKGPIPVSRSTFYAWVAAGKAPKQLALGSRVSAWRVGDIRAFLATLQARQ